MTAWERLRWRCGAAAALALPLMGFVCAGPPRVIQRVVTTPGFVEPHTPGSGDPQEMAASTRIHDLLGPRVNLNRVTTVRTSFVSRVPKRPRAILILIPGFLGGATTFDPLARTLVEQAGGDLEVWAVDRRPNQLEDRLGGVYAAKHAQDASCTSTPPQPDCGIFTGAQFYFADTDVPPLGDFPGPGDLDLNGNGVLDSQRPLRDRLGAVRGPLLMSEDDARFMAYWGLDTYFRDWRWLVLEARLRVGPHGVVLLGGHSQGTTWAATFAAYDFDPSPNRVRAGYALIDGLVLLEGGGAGPPAASPPTLASYQQTVASLAQPGGPDVFLQDLGPIPLQALGTAGEVSAVAGFTQPFEPALLQRIPAFGTGLLSLLLGAPATNRALTGFFLDDDYSPLTFMRMSAGFSIDGPNTLLGPPLFPSPAYLAGAKPGGGLRTWLSYDDPALPTCPPSQPDVSPGCAILDNGPPSDPNDPTASPRVNGVEREVTSIDTFLQTQFGKNNGFEWYFASGRPDLDFAYGRDSSALVQESLAQDPTDEGPLVITQNANVDVPVLAIGASNGLAPEPRSFASYLDSIATPDGEKEVDIIPGYAHLDIVMAEQNDAVPLIQGFVKRVMDQKP